MKKSNGRSKADQLSELKRLKQELKVVKEERDILKKFAAYAEAVKQKD